MASYQSPKLGLKYYYEVWPLGLPMDVAFIHGNLASRRWWYPLKDILQNKSTGDAGTGRMFLLEFLGCGLSEAPRTLSDVNMHQFAEDFNELLKSENFRGALVGHSTGGLIAALMMGQMPTLYQGGFALDPVGVRGVTFDEAMIQAFEAMKADPALTSAVIGSTILGLDPKNAFFQEVIAPDAYLSVRQVGAWVLQALAGFNAQKEVEQIQSPFWVVHGSEDKLLPIEDSRHMAKAAPRGQFFEEPGAGHCLNYENPQRLADLLLSWLEAIKN